MKDEPASFSVLTATWLALVALTLASLALGEWFGAASWLPLLVAAIIWAKGAIIAANFLEIGRAHPFIRRLVKAFIAFSPMALFVTAFFGDRIARWSAL